MNCSTCQKPMVLLLTSYVCDHCGQSPGSTSTQQFYTAYFFVDTDHTYVSSLTGLYPSGVFRTREEAEACKKPHHNICVMRKKTPFSYIGNNTGPYRITADRRDLDTNPDLVWVESLT